MTTKYNYRIIASMSDYDSSRHPEFSSKPLVEKIGSTEYRIWKDGLSKVEAYKEFERWASEEGSWYDEEVIAEEVAEVRAKWNEAAGPKADEGMSEYSAEDWMQENRWYEGPGWYIADGQLLWDGVSEYYHDDIWTFEIQEA